MHVQRRDIRCNVSDAIVANLAVHIVFFFERRLDTDALARSFAMALTNLPLFAGRMAAFNGSMRIRCDGQGVPFTSVASGRTLQEAIRSSSEGDGLWLIDPVNGAAARWGRGPLCKVRVTRLADDATAIGFSWHHVIGDMQTLMHFMNAWAAAAADEPLAEPLIVDDRAAYLDEHLPADGTCEPGVRCLELPEFARSALYLAKDARKHRTLTFAFDDDEVTHMRAAFQNGMRLSANDVVCGHVSEAIMTADPSVDHRTLAIAVNARTRCGLDPMLMGNIITTLNIDVRRGESASSIAHRIRNHVDHFADEHCDMRANQRLMDAAGRWRGARCVSIAFDSACWNPLISNWCGFGVYRIRFEETSPLYCVPLLTKLPVAGLGVLLEGTHGSGIVFRMSLPPGVFEDMSGPAIGEHIHRFRRAGDDMARPHRESHG